MSRCRACGETIVWIRTTNGKNMPCDEEPVEYWNDEFGNTNKDCKHRDPEDKKCDCGRLHHAGTIFPVPDNHFCADGRKKDGDSDG